MGGQISISIAKNTQFSISVRRFLPNLNLNKILSKKGLFLHIMLIVLHIIEDVSFFGIELERIFWNIYMTIRMAKNRRIGVTFVNICPK